MSQPSHYHDTSATIDLEQFHEEAMDIDDFEAALAELIELANEHDVHIGRAFDVRSDADEPDWMIEISQLR
ncbi:hypothetical protein [Natrononativus amylolyticus]|uniref:hypothetical protein n=1 Tax=Natrononativus amylolyticus TaxID=2963434 RepID=UPI0020CD4F4E|nr:hypothetical protein [Natrononativus amylolyticus]